MPAETHIQREPIDADAVIDVIWTSLPEVADRVPEPDTRLDDLGIHGDLQLLELWDLVTDELAERSVAEPDIGELLSATTVGELAEVVVRALARR